MTEKPQLGPVFSEFLERGNRLLNAALLAPTEKDHVRTYYNFMRPESNSRIVDLGCGTGHYGVMLQEIDPSLEIDNVVNDMALVQWMDDEGIPCFYSSFESTPLPSECADVVMFNEAIGHGDLGKCFDEAFRLLKTNGILTMKDFTTVDLSQEVLSFDSWGYKVYRQDIMISVAYQHGFNLVEVKHPKMYTKEWFEIVEKHLVEYVSTYDKENMPLCSVLYTVVKGNLNGRSQS